jgi:pyruvate formate lyase activating enzyme
MKTGIKTINLLRKYKMDTILSKPDGEKLECLLCPHLCKLAKGKTGICGVRKNTGERIGLSTYGVISGFALDPIEKKPLYHYFPGSNILSIGSYGCNMRCDFCQNYHISQNVPESSSALTTPSEILEHTRKVRNNTGIAFTYNEPVIWFEFVRDVAVLIKEAGFHTVMVSNGFVSAEPLKEYLTLIDAFNIDLKAFSEDFYRKIAGASLAPVLDSLKMIAKAGNHLEVTTLLVPGINDSKEEMEELVKWISGELGRSVPFHISRYFPMHKRKEGATPHETLKRFYDIALKWLDYVYVGNVMSESGQDTHCPQCKILITRRSGYSIRHVNTTDGNCSGCGKKIYNDFTFSSS